MHACQVTTVVSDSLRPYGLVALQAPLSMGFSRQEYWRGLPRPPPGDLLDLGIELDSLTCPALSGMFFTISDTWEAQRVGALQTWVQISRPRITEHDFINSASAHWRGLPCARLSRSLWTPA